MALDFTHGRLGNSGIEVHRLGLSCSYRPGKRAVFTALDQGVNFFFCYGFDSQAVGTLREIFKTRRRDCVVATGAYNLVWGHPNLRRTLEKRLRQLQTDYLDLFLFLGVLHEKELTAHVQEELCRFREEGKVRCVGVSTHDLRLAGRLAAEGVFNAIMMRYNAAHRGAEQELFPYLPAHDPAVIGYTATQWRYLLKRPHGWPASEPVPDAGMGYRFVLSNPLVDVCLTAPSNAAQLRENLAALSQGPLNERELAFMRRFGDAAQRSHRWFL